MGNPVLVVSASTRIARPIEAVRRHFADVEHHRTSGVHPDVVFTPLGSSGDEHRIRKTTRLLGIPIVDEVLLRRQPDGSVTEDSVGGANTRMRLVTRFQDAGPALTVTILTIEVPIRGLRRALAPLLRPLIGRRLAQALGEDRRDLEEGGYV